jgi:hypothetical protein
MQVTAVLRDLSLQDGANLYEGPGTGGLEPLREGQLSRGAINVAKWRYLCIPAVGSDSKIPPFRDREDGAF